MVSAELLDNHYWEWAKYALEPLCDAGIKPICHCDGNVMPVMDRILEVGFQGLQGFQEELGVNLSELVKLRTHGGEPLLFFCGLLLWHGGDADDAVRLCRGCARGHQVYGRCDGRTAEACSSSLPTLSIQRFRSRIFGRRTPTQRPTRLTTALPPWTGAPNGPGHVETLSHS